MTDDHQTPSESRDRSDLASRVDELDCRLTEVEAAVQALRGYVGGRRAAVANVGRRADAALAAVDRLERDRQGAESDRDRQGAESKQDQPDTDARGSQDDRDPTDGVEQ